MRLFRRGLGQDAVLDEVACEPDVPLLQEGGGSRQHAVQPAGERYPLARLFATAGRKQIVRLPLVPAAVETPDVPDEELGVVVDRPEVWLLQELFGERDLVQHGVERRPRVHQREHLPFQGFEQLRGVSQRRPDALRPEDRPAVARDQQLGAQRCHLPEPGGPLSNPALHLLGIAGVGNSPDEEVARGEELPLRHPRPGRILGLPARMAQLEGELALPQRQLSDVGNVRIAIVSRPTEGRIDAQAGNHELTPVDSAVPPLGLLVPIKVLADELMPVDERARDVPLLGLLVERRHPEDVIDVVVRENGRRQPPVRPPAAHRLVQWGAIVRCARVEHDQRFAGVQGSRTGETLIIEDTVLDLLRLPFAIRRRHGMRLEHRIDFAVP